MKINVQLLGQARHLATTERIELEAPDDASVDDLVPAILVQAGTKLEPLLSDNGKLRRSVMAILNDETIDPSTSGILLDNAELSLLPPMSGG